MYTSYDACHGMYSGQMLGDLPSLHKQQTAVASAVPAVAESKQHQQHQQQNSSSSSGSSLRQQQHRSSSTSSSSAYSTVSAPSVQGPVLPDNTPQQYVCQLSKRIMKEPLRTPYGNVYDRQMILLWLQRQGSIDPLTGQPLVESQVSVLTCFFKM
jgi:U-box domain